MSEREGKGATGGIEGSLWDSLLGDSFFVCIVKTQPGGCSLNSVLD